MAPTPTTSRSAIASCSCISVIFRLTGKIAERGLTLVPLRLYFKKGRAKLELGLARGKKLHDKRSSLREREVRREMDRAARDSRRSW